MRDKAELHAIHQSLLDTLPDRPWLKVLETLNVSGVADSLQLRLAPRGSLRRPPGSFPV